MHIKTYWRSLDKLQQRSFAQNAGTSALYIERHLIQQPPTRHPRPSLLRQLANASDGHLSHYDLYSHFYGAIDDQSALLADIANNP